ncbi:hypothetical protein [Cryobacterium sp. BB736]|uniref:hypothetical protein n=1 Tax=Cryobacterium sp. BB736 TaxID=2746963 RepID=UPI0018750DE0|nr:hypothetical protein [Cryobacterium sp. BB736]
MTRRRNRSGLFSAVLTGFVVAGLLAGCTTAPAEPESEAVVKAPDALTAEGVVLAAVLLSTADITAAVAEGLVTPAEVDAARAAIEDGTLDEWRVRAEKERSEAD